MKNSPVRHIEDVAQRELEIVGDEPRVLPLKPDEMTEYALEMHERIRGIANRDLIEVTRDNMPEVIATMLRHPDLFEMHSAVGIQLMINGTLPPRERELAVLRIGWLCGAPYEFGEHVFMAHDVGISSDEVDAIKSGPSYQAWSVHEQAILTAVDELFSDAMISDATWAVLAMTFDERQLIELPMLVGQYQQVAYVQNSLKIRLHPGNAGLKAR